ncbi:MAG: acyl--CoA ligase [Nitrospinae bacterium]|nr:acyl--CoA ligase [Nitrospinota bacterium]
MMGPQVPVHEMLGHWAAVHPDKDFIYHHGGSYTYSDVEGLSLGFSSFLSCHGVGGGDVVAIMLPRVPELVAAFVGACRTGALPAPVNYLLGEAGVAEFLERASPKVIVTSGKLSGLLPDGATGKSLVVVIEGNMAGAIPWERAVEGVYDARLGVSDPSEVCYLNYTTGSTGNPKGALATHSNIYWNTASCVEAFGMTREDVHLCMFASFAHPHELFARALWTGGSLALLEEISPKAISGMISKRNVTCVMGLSPMYRMMEESISGRKFASLRVAESGGMLTDPGINKGFMKRFGIPVLSVWGSTETTGVALANTPSAYRTDGSIGRPCPGYEVAVIGEGSDDVDNGGVGELAVRGGGVVGGYLESGGGTADGWWRTGDLVRRGGDGYYHFVERRSGMIKSAGLKVYPTQIELALCAHPAVSAAAVVPVEDRLRGQVPAAFVELRADSVAGAEEISEFLRGRLAAYMIPRRLDIVDRLPRIGSGKIDKRGVVRTFVKPLEAAG